MFVVPRHMVCVRMKWEWSQTINNFSSFTKDENLFYKQSSIIGTICKVVIVSYSCAMDMSAVCSLQTGNFVCIRFASCSVLCGFGGYVTGRFLWLQCLCGFDWRSCDTEKCGGPNADKGSADFSWSRKARANTEKESNILRQDLVYTFLKWKKS